MKRTKRPNRLIHEKSPYLLQHAYNPVDWYPWGPEAFEKAQSEDKPIFLSIGYATCHWCHVMERESFEDPATAGRMNEIFVPIKVDREERPEIDALYMKICQVMTGSGGWPLTLVLTPDRKPLFAGTYLPREGRFGRMGMSELISWVEEIWRKRRDECIGSAERVMEEVRRPGPSPVVALGIGDLDAAYRELRSAFDQDYGGFGSSPKFPTPHNLLFLLRYWKRTGSQDALLMVEKTLDSMSRGGIFDQLGFGFHRYSTDRKWLLPHFEKMLYDQALLALAYTEAFQATGKLGYRMTACRIFEYVLRDMSSPQGGFYSAQDADSEGEEGKFYLWTADEVRMIVGEEDADVAAKVFGITKEGNIPMEWPKEGLNVLHIEDHLSAIAADLAMVEGDLRNRVEAIRRKLLEARSRRVPPLTDEKILTDWNGLMIVALARSAQVFDEPAYAKAAEAAARFILAQLRSSDGRLLHRYRDGQAAIQATLDDYAFLVWGLIELYETTLNAAFLNEAVALNGDLLKHFWDDEGGGLYLSPDDGEDLPLRQKEACDGAIPSGNSAAMLNMVRLSRLIGDAQLDEKAFRLCMAFSGQLRRTPSAHTHMFSALDFSIGPAFEVIVAGVPGGKDTEQMLKAARSSYVPNRVVMLNPTGPGSLHTGHVPAFLRRYGDTDGKATAYICEKFSCRVSTTDPAKVKETLGRSFH